MRLLAVVAHPDDETLGCGGTLVRFAAARAIVCVVTHTDGVSSRRGLNSPAKLERAIVARRRHFDAAMSVLGISRGIHNAFHDQEIDAATGLSLARAVSAQVGLFKPDVVLTHWPADLNKDHRLVAEAVLVATRPATDDGRGVRAVYAFETPSSTEWAFGCSAFRPDTFVELSAHAMDKKLIAAACYTDEMRADPHPRSPGKIKALAEMRGAAIGVQYAEALVTLRRRVPLEGML